VGYIHLLQSYLYLCQKLSEKCDSFCNASFDNSTWQCDDHRYFSCVTFTIYILVLCTVYVIVYFTTRIVIVNIQLWFISVNCVRVVCKTLDR